MPGSCTQNCGVLQAAGKLDEVARDWKFLPDSFHSEGMEALLQLHILVGFPRTINALAAVQEVGVKGDSSWSQEQVSDADKIRSRGEEACAAVYGGKYVKLRARMAALHPLLDVYMVEHAYGRVIARESSLSLRMRELCIISVLVGQEVAPQLASHIFGALNVGATEEEIRTVIQQSDLVWGNEAHSKAEDVLRSLHLENKRSKL
mmetsp:Transcript_11985/g.18777  ORF Transcript_11985/g.18777 Transcript_11985/m.18777 type:complete len:205 (+) Transcript_11985:85-699(+)